MYTRQFACLHAIIVGLQCTAKPIVGYLVFWGMASFSPPAFLYLYALYCTQKSAIIIPVVYEITSIQLVDERACVIERHAI